MRWGAIGLPFSISLLLGAGCGGSTERGLDDGAGGATSSTTSTLTTGTGGGLPEAGPDADLDAGSDAPIDAVSDYVDPGCPDAEPPPPEIECDPFATPTGCEPGFACYPFIERPGGDGCGFERYGASCLLPGPVQAGGRCGRDYGWCGEGMLCVVGALSGARCLTMCDPFGPATCPGGLICTSVDVEGIGVCG